MGARSPQRRTSAGATTPLLLLALAFWAGTARAALATTCYLELGSKLILGSSDSACGVVNDTSVPLTCCAVGDVCLGHNICQVPTGPRGPGYSGYYLGGCNDPNFKDPACTTHCTSNLLPDVVYNTTTKQWNCCSTINNVVDCNHPVAEAFDAPAPTDLSSTFSIPLSTSTATSTSSPLTPPSSTTSSTTTTTAPSGASGSSSSSSSSSSLSTGAQAGIGVGVATAGLALIALAALLLCRLRRRRNPTSPLPPPSTGSALLDARQSQTYRDPAWQALSHHPPSHAPYHAAVAGGGGGQGTAGVVGVDGIDEWVTSQIAAGGAGGGGGGVFPKSELPTPEQNDPARYGHVEFGRARAGTGTGTGTGMDAFELASNEVRRELGIMP